MMPAVESYLAVRRAAGFKLLNADYLLRSFARFASQRGEIQIRTQSANDWAAEAASVAQRDARLKCVCVFARYLRADIDHLIKAAAQLGPPGALRSQTYAALIALLSATGLRISEALCLQFADITPEGLLIRKTKFQKTRLVPLHQTAAEGLRIYLTLRGKVRRGDEHVFVDDDGRSLTYSAAYEMFQKLLKIAGIVGTPNGQRPRLHGLRHSFAVRALEASPEGRAHIGQHMLALATYLGHVNIYSTYWYLEATPVLLRDIAQAAEGFLTGEQK